MAGIGLRPIILPTLWKHQEDLRDRTREAVAKHIRVIMCSGCGTGKTRIAKWILGSSANREPTERQSGRSLFAVHRRGLVDNASNSFNEDPELDHAVIMSGVKPGYGARIQVASIDTLLSWFIENDQYNTNITFDLIVWDEAHSHHPKFAKFLQLHDAFRAEQGKHPAFVIGLTATPQADGLADIYREIVQGPSTQWLIDEGFLAPFRYVRAVQGQLGLLVKRGGEFTQDSEAAAMSGLSGDLVRDWKKFAQGRTTVGFFPRRSHAQEAREELSKAGLKVDYIDGETEDHTRRRIFWELTEGHLDYLCNVQVVERGTDIPRIGCIQLCVAIGSIVRYRQMIGRGSRIHPEKTDCLILDHGGNVKRHGLFTDDPLWSLDRSRRDVGEVGARPTIECPQCQAIYRGGKCRNCGYEPTKKERKAQGLEFDGSELQEVKQSEKQRKVKAPEDLMIVSLYSAGRSGRTWKQAVGMFFGMARAQGTPTYKIPRWVVVGGHKYRMLPYRSPDSGRRVEDLFPFTVDRGNHGGNYHLGEE
jgi:DNA repair protein RadD